MKTHKFLAFRREISAFIQARLDDREPGVGLHFLQVPGHQAIHETLPGRGEGTMADSRGSVANGTRSGPPRSISSTLLQLVKARDQAGWQRFVAVYEPSL